VGGRLDPGIIKTLEDLTNNALRKDATFYLRSGNNNKYISQGGAGITKGDWEKLTVEDAKQTPFASVPASVYAGIQCPEGYKDLGATCYKPPGTERSGLGVRPTPADTKRKTEL
jgi:hypothetical protein